MMIMNNRDIRYGMMMMMMMQENEGMKYGMMVMMKNIQAITRHDNGRLIYGMT